MDQRGGNNRKRARDQGVAETEEDHPTKRPDLIDDHNELEITAKEHISFDEYSSTGTHNNNVLTDGEEGVFDFPWLKEEEGTTIFKAAEEECFLFDNIFASPSSSSFSSGVVDNAFGQQSLCPIPNLVNLHDDHDQEKITHDDDDDDLRSFQADELEGADWICGSVFDHCDVQPPLANNGFNKVV